MAEIILGDFILIDGHKHVLQDMRDFARKNKLYRLNGVQRVNFVGEYATEADETFYEIEVTVREKGMDGDAALRKINIALPEDYCEKLNTSWQRYIENKTFFKYDSSACRLTQRIDDDMAWRISKAVKELELSRNPDCGKRAAKLFG